MPGPGRSPYLELLRDQIDYTRVPFTDRGSRVLVFREAHKPSLYIRHATRVAGLEIGTEAYKNRRPFIWDLCLVDGTGSPLDFDLAASPDALRFHTRIGDFGLVFQNEKTLSFGVPAHTPAGLHFRTAADVVRAQGSESQLTDTTGLDWASNGQFIRNAISRHEDDCSVELQIGAGNDLAISVAVGNAHGVQDTTLPFSECLGAARARWNNWFSRVPRVAPEYQRTYAYAWWVLVSNLVSPAGRMAYEAVMPSKMSYIGIWQWDCAFHALALRHVDPELARNQLRVMLACQNPAGMLPDAIYDEGAVFEIDHPFHAEVTKPLLLAWAALKVHEKSPDRDFLKEIYEPLVRLNTWWLSMNDDDGDGLAQYNHPYSSGLDNSPLWDYGMPAESPDLNTYLSIQMDALAAISDILGSEDESLLWRQRADSIVQSMIRDLWDNDAGLFRAVHDEQPIPVVTPFNLLPLWTGRLSERIRKRLIAHLTATDEFWCTNGIPSVARNDPHYDPERMWRGPTWTNINYLFVEALTRCSELDLARVLRRRTLRLIMNQPDIAEYYDPESGKPPPGAAGMFSWSAAVFIDLALAATMDEESEPSAKTNVSNRSAKVSR